MKLHWEEGTKAVEEDVDQEDEEEEEEDQEAEELIIGVKAVLHMGEVEAWTTVLKQVCTWGMMLAGISWPQTVRLAGIKGAKVGQ